MGRSTKKGPFVDFKLFRKVQRQDEANSKEPIKTWARACTIVPEFVGHTFMVHDGRRHVKVFVTEDMGRPQIGGVRAHADVPQPQRQGEALSGSRWGGSRRRRHFIASKS